MRRDDLFDLTGRVAIVTGGTGILGPRHAEALAAFGAQVVIVDREPKACEETARRLGPQVAGFAADVSREPDVRALAAFVMERFHRVDVLVNNAATKSPNMFAPFEEFPLADWNEVMAVNVTGVFLCSRVLGALMAEAGSGSIINIASIYGVVAPDQRIYEGAEYQGVVINTPAVYSVSKGAVVNMTRYLATYWPHRGVRANTITPGGVESGQNETFQRRYADRVPLGRMARQDELQGAIVFLASDASRYVTGHNLLVEGGWTVW